MCSPGWYQTRFSCLGLLSAEVADGTIPRVLGREAFCICVFAQEKKSNIFVSSFVICLDFIDFSCLIAVARTPSPSCKLSMQESEAGDSLI